jgi:precorrin-6x reductase
MSGYAEEYRRVLLIQASHPFPEIKSQSVIYICSKQQEQQQDEKQRQ